MPRKSALFGLNECQHFYHNAAPVELPPPRKKYNHNSFVQQKRQPEILACKANISAFPPVEKQHRQSAAQNPAPRAPMPYKLIIPLDLSQNQPNFPYHLGEMAPKKRLSVAEHQKSFHRGGVAF